MPLRAQNGRIIHIRFAMHVYLHNIPYSVVVDHPSNILYQQHIILIIYHYTIRRIIARLI